MCVLVLLVWCFCYCCLGVFVFVFVLLFSWFCLFWVIFFFPPLGDEGKTLNEIVYFHD